MAQRKLRNSKGKSSSIIKRLRARLAAYKVKRKAKPFKTKSMAFGRNRRRRRSFSFRSPFRRRSFSQRSNGGGFNRRLPVVGWRIPSIFIWLAIAGGAIFFGKDYIKPLIDKLKSKV